MFHRLPTHVTEAIPNVTPTPVMTPPIGRNENQWFHVSTPFTNYCLYTFLVAHVFFSHQCVHPSSAFSHCFATMDEWDDDDCMAPALRKPKGGVIKKIVQKAKALAKLTRQKEMLLKLRKAMLFKSPGAENIASEAH